MSKSILVVGAGALGMTTAYHLQLAGARIEFLVRPNRVQALSRPQKLYSYGDHSLKTLDNFAVHSDCSAIAGGNYDFVLLTLDGAACRTDEGQQLLSTLGVMLANSRAVLVICGVGMGLYHYVQTVTGLSSKRILEGTMSIYAYQVGRAQMPLPPPTNIDLHNEADIAYCCQSAERGFMVTSQPAGPSKAFTELFNQCGATRCARMPTGLYRAFTSAFFTFTAACEITDWHSTDRILNDAELWPLCCQAQREILRMKQHGLLGRIISWVMTNKRQAETVRQMERDGQAIGFMEFNHFHHGGKVQNQDIQTLVDCARIGEQQGQNMRACKALISRLKDKGLTV
ncbi:ketopantoate reductase family protein [Halioxenophilus sp. WMMB6]|uniref:ketopantoate reductase family protein n=1 Tax=Halioxenophilus sp. WMMB6 TaxID=3073815 RepID=UPI00295E94C5|nr:2-dehydropantoate 2-reductase N-terminal domain-containing protein [Halioxenophilus sp. WMMB6]